jgi:putative membrane protein
MAGNGATSRHSGCVAARRAAVALLVFLAGVAAIFLLNPAGLYLWIKAIHVIAVMSWMAGMLYLPRLFIYHCDAEPGSVQSETFKVMERRLLRVIMNPAMIISWSMGVWIAWSGVHFLDIWFLVKFACVIALSAVHGMFAKAVRLFAEDRNDRSPRYWRMMNEAPTLLMIAILILVIVKPF